ncbi:hypothetical protein NPIL_611721 [Nephila pilipes]|uniref:Uncharacterized protein n=1 Tax=Nephila pilipes TaxID=299642 RepID=A0A8X6PHD0_NEPPI|nr:hypothetical protein NPIL_611721 [Nephila pilipes]
MPFVGDIEFLQEFCSLFKSIEFSATEVTGERGKLKESALVQYKMRFDKALLSTWISKLNNEIREESESSDSDGGQLSLAPSSSRGKKNLQNCEDDFREDPHKMVQDNWRVRKKSKFLEEFDTSSLPLPLKFSIYFKCPNFKLKETH